MLMYTYCLYSITLMTFKPSVHLFFPFQYTRYCEQNGNKGKTNTKIGTSNAYLKHKKYLVVTEKNMTFMKKNRRH